MPTILGEGSDVFVADVERSGIALLVGAGDSEEKVREVGAGLRAIEDKRSVVDGIGFDIDLIEVEAASEFERMAANYLGKIVAPLKGIVDLPLARYVDADGEVVERNVLDALDTLVQRNNAKAACIRAIALLEALRGQRFPTPPTGLPMTLKSRM